MIRLILQGAIGAMAFVLAFYAYTAYIRHDERLKAPIQIEQETKHEADKKVDQSHAAVTKLDHHFATKPDSVREPSPYSRD